MTCQLCAALYESRGKASSCKWHVQLDTISQRHTLSTPPLLKSFTLGPKGTGEQVVWTLHCTPLILSTDWCCWKDPSWPPQPRKHGEKLLHGIYQAILSNSYWALESFHPKTRWRRSARSSLATWPPCRCHNTEGNLEGATGLGLLLPHLDFHCPRQASYSRKEWASYGSKNNRRWV